MLFVFNSIHQHKKCSSSLHSTVFIVFLVAVLKISRKLLSVCYKASSFACLSSTQLIQPQATNNTDVIIECETQAHETFIHEKNRKTLK